MTRTPNPYQPLADAAPAFGPDSRRRGGKSKIRLLEIRNALIAWERGYAAGQADTQAALKAAKEEKP